MRVLAVTCCTGDAELAAMTGRMIHGLRESVPDSTELRVSVLAQDCPHPIGTTVDYLTFHPRNVGFAFGMNRAIAAARWEPDFVLCLNNDLEFPNKNWLHELLKIAVFPKDQVLVPATDSAAIRVQPGPINKASFPVEESSAYAWLVPFKWCKWLKETHGFWLFDESFQCYGEDNWSAFLLSKQFGEKIFRYVPRSFVKHLRGRTSRTVKHDRKVSNRTLVDKLNGELKDPTLRPDLRGWATRYVSILSRRI